MNKLLLFRCQLGSCFPKTVELVWWKMATSHHCQWIIKVNSTAKEKILLNFIINWISLRNTKNYFFFQKERKGTFLQSRPVILNLFQPATPFYSKLFLRHTQFLKHTKLIACIMFARQQNPNVHSYDTKFSEKRCFQMFLIFLKI